MISSDVNGGRRPGASSHFRLVTRLEWAVALGFALLAVCLHGVFAWNAGGLWRDEAETVGLAGLSSLEEIWDNLQYYSFPILWPIVVRSLAWMGLASDSFLRFTGFVIGVSIVGALWFVGRCFRTGPPLFSQILFALCSSVIIWGDSIRAHGCGLLTGLIAYGLLWRLAEASSRSRLLIAAGVSVVAVQTSYYNCIVVLAACCGGVALAAQRRQLRHVWIMLAAGFPAALSILPYFPTFQKAAMWNMLVRVPVYDFPRFWMKISEAMDSERSYVIWLWVALLVAGFVLGIAALFLKQWKIERERRDVILFSLASLMTGIPAYYAFLKILHYSTLAWYYLVLLGLTAVGIESILRTVCTTVRARAVILCVCVAGFVFMIPGFMGSLPMRMTNVDILALRLRQEARKGDLIIVNPWYCGITWARYHTSSVPWTTVPPLEFHRYHRFDLIKLLMKDADQFHPVAAVLQQIRETLRSGGRVFVVGYIPVLPSGSEPRRLPPAPQSEFGWSADRYVESWSLQVAYFLREHSKQGQEVEPVARERINPYENMPLWIVEGWKD